MPVTDAEERRIVLAQETRPSTSGEPAGLAKSDDRQLDRAVSALRSIDIYNERQSALRTAAANRPAVKADDGTNTPSATR